MSEIDPADIKFKWPVPEQKVEATPRPWKAATNGGCKDIRGDKDGTFKQSQYRALIATTAGREEPEDRANARLIVTAVNAYEANQALISELVGALGACSKIGLSRPHDGSQHDADLEAVLMTSQAALAKASAK